MDLDSLSSQKMLNGNCKKLLSTFKTLVDMVINTDADTASIKFEWETKGDGWIPSLTLTITAPEDRIASAKYQKKTR